jgi:Ca-activated chloride channel family protein
MEFTYGEYEGQPFTNPDALFPQPKVMQFILQYGDKALDALEQLDDEQEQQFVQEMIDAGLLEEYQDEEGRRRLRLTPKMLRGLQHKALEEVFTNLRKGSREGHQTQMPGRTTERTEGTKAYEFGDPVSELDLGSTMRNAAARQLGEAGRLARGPGGSALPLRLSDNDFELHLTEGSADVATVMLLDLSGSMMRYGRFYQAKRIALGMQALIRERFPQDTLDYVGFYSLAERIREQDIPLVMPKPVSIHDYSVRLRMPLQQAQANPKRIPLHFTNLQMGLRIARQILARKGAANKQVFIVTDGQPTAHIEPAGAAGGSGSAEPAGEEMLYLLYPPNERTSTITLKEALRCQQQGIRLATFALIEDYWGMDWVGFVDQMTRLTRGIAYYCTSEDLSSTVVESYLSGKKKKSFVS